MNLIDYVKPGTMLIWNITCPNIRGIDVILGVVDERYCCISTRVSEGNSPHTYFWSCPFGTVMRGVTQLITFEGRVISVSKVQLEEALNEAYRSEVNRFEIIHDV